MPPSKQASELREPVTPPLKWAGGKRWLANKLVAEFSSLSGRYIEPFVGSASVFFAMRPEAAILSDTNADLINFYSTLKDHPTLVAQCMQRHSKKHSEQYYYKTRSKRPIDPVERAAWFLYLNRTCWNGLYRVNQEGIFNVPKGSKTRVLLESDDFNLISATLSLAKLVVSDFEPIIDATKTGDLIFADPPYTVQHNFNGFVKYNENLFTWSDQIRLRDAAVRAALRGVTVIVTNADHPSIRELYSDGATITHVHRASVIASSSSRRGPTTELLIELR